MPSWKITLLTFALMASGIGVAQGAPTLDAHAPIAAVLQPARFDSAWAARLRQRLYSEPKLLQQQWQEARAKRDRPTTAQAAARLCTLGADKPGVCGEAEKTAGNLKRGALLLDGR